jgi:hypothetical protein
MDIEAGIRQADGHDHRSFMRSFICVALGAGLAVAAVACEGAHADFPPADAAADIGTGSTSSSGGSGDDGATSDDAASAGDTGASSEGGDATVVDGDAAAVEGGGGDAGSEGGDL